jgi:DNA-binding transcriptional MocR family regulator
MTRPAEALYQQIAESIASPIRAGTLRRGERLPSVRRLASERGVSQATAVQALRLLEDSRLVEARPRSGYFVAARAPALPEPGLSAPPAQSMAVDLSSLIDQMMALAQHPDYTSFGAACPEAALFSQERVRRAASRAVLRHRDTLCRYPSEDGAPALRRAIARHALRLGCSFDPQQIQVTNSCRESIALCLRTVTRPGDVVALESPTFFGSLQVLQSLGLRALEIPTHPRTGISVDALQLALETQPVAAVLAVPTLSNPLGATMPLAERKRLAALLARHEAAFIEDVIYNDFAEQEDARRTVKSFDTEGRVMLCGSFSKSLAPGLSLGWVEPGRHAEAFRRQRVAGNGGQSALVEHALADLLGQPGVEAARRQLCRTFAARLDEARGLISETFPKGTRVTDPPGGYILWVELPPGSDAVALYQACIAERIVIAPGTMFSATERYRHCLRLGLGGRWDAAQRAGLRRVGALATQLCAERLAA